MTKLSHSIETEVLVIGAGPVGLLLSHLLGQAGIKTLLVEKRDTTDAPSMAIGLMPASLRLFRQAGLSDALLAAGVQVRHAIVHDQHKPIGQLDFTGLPPPFAFILSLPQGSLMRILRDRLSERTTVQFAPGRQAIGIIQKQGHIRVTTQDTLTGQISAHDVRYVIGCDGHDSDLRRFLNIPIFSKCYASEFVMGDFPDTTDWGEAAHLFFTPTGSIESFPLPGKTRRWVALAPHGTHDTDILVQQVQNITGWQLPTHEEKWHSWFIPRRQLANMFYQGRAILCGDAAHVMSPIGGQGMNTGLADARHLAGILIQALRTGTAVAPLLAGYDAARRHAFSIAANRAARGMWLGAHKGRLFSAMRSRLIQGVLLRPPLANRLPAYFAMLTIPHGPIPALEAP